MPLLRPCLRSVLLPAALVCLAPMALQAEGHVAAWAEPALIRAGETTRLSASLLATQRSQPVIQPAWEWSRPAGSAGTLFFDGLGRLCFRAPQDLEEPRDFTFDVQSSHEPLDRAQVTLRVLPAKALPTGLEKKDLPGRDLERPSLRLLAGEGGTGTTYAPFEQDVLRGVSDLVWVPREDGLEIGGHWLVADEVRRQLLTLDGEGRWQPWVGRMRNERAAWGPLGWDTVPVLDGKGTEAQFSHPAVLAVRPAELKQPWAAVVLEPADSVIRMVDAQGQVSTLAGTQDKPGYLDGPCAETLFNQPMGVTWGADGAIYVADQGNQVIRRIFQGQVSTLAGCPGSRTGWDGKGEEAGFAMPGRMASDPRTGNLLVVDGQSIRAVTLAGEVTTLAGCATSGFEDGLARAPRIAAPDRMKGIPCLDRCRGISVRDGIAYLADRSNHALRALDLDTGALTTLAGDKSQEWFRPGQLAFVSGLPAADRARAALTAPNAVAFGEDGRCLVAMPCGIAEADLDLAEVARRRQAWTAAGVEPKESKEEKKESKAMAGLGAGMIGPYSLTMFQDILLGRVAPLHGSPEEIKGASKAAALPEGGAAARESDQILLTAARLGDDALAQVALEGGADINVIAPGEGTPLMIAARAGKLPLVRFLLSREGLKIDLGSEAGDTALTLAQAKGHEAIAKALLAKGAWAPDGRTSESRTSESRTSESRTSESRTSESKA